MMDPIRRLKTLCILLFTFFALGACNPGPGPDPGVGINQQIFESWQFNEIIRKGCIDANNNLRRYCTDCTALVMNTDNTFEVTDINDALLIQGTFRQVTDNEIIFDPSIFTNSGISTVRYTLLRGGLRFDYTDPETNCEVTEAYLVQGNNVAGD